MARDFMRLCGVVVRECLVVLTCARPNGACCNDAYVRPSVSLPIYT